ncbi:Hypothetical_protein [Hexamita inflata]|uniref:Hypothetical_protein n=1 Tax=Hexamita inflata TaxID=28002 RepID=A0AA86T9Z4_9EUKA|nr:Hypothetical protein HINF_LOCUS899 [Hexamita inflata]
MIYNASNFQNYCCTTSSLLKHIYTSLDQDALSMKVNEVLMQFTANPNQAGKGFILITSLNQQLKRKQISSCKGDNQVKRCRPQYSRLSQTNFSKQNQGGNKSLEVTSKITPAKIHMRSQAAVILTQQLLSELAL